MDNDRTLRRKDIYHGQRNRALGQWFTPAWAAEGIIEQEFDWLAPSHTAVDPSCEDGAFLCELPTAVRAVVVEINPLQAALARKHSGREILVGDFATLPVDHLGKVQVVIGNPPFQSDLVTAFRGRCHDILEDGGTAGFILPAYILQTSSKVESFAAQFTIRQQVLPQNLFPDLKFLWSLLNSLRRNIGSSLASCYTSTPKTSGACPRNLVWRSETRVAGSVWRHVLWTRCAPWEARLPCRRSMTACKANGRRPMRSGRKRRVRP